MHSSDDIVSEFARHLGVRQTPAAPGGALLLALDPHGILGLETAALGPEPDLLLYLGWPVSALGASALRHALDCSHATRLVPCWPQLGLRRMGEEFHLLALLRLPERKVSLSVLSRSTDLLWQWLGEALALGDGHV